MKKKNLLRSSILIILSILLISGGNVKALNQLDLYLPIVFQGITETPAPTATPTIPTTQPPPSTTEPPPPATTVPPPPATTGDVEISNIFYIGTGPGEPNEYVEIENVDTVPVQLMNWTLRDEANHIFTFPSFVIQPSQKCRVYTNEDHPESCGFSYGSSSAIWDNAGDTAYLRDGNGTLIDDISY